jgi:xanthine/CO dehydrogenase XdhC/CoxF family maturation factor
MRSCSTWNPYPIGVRGISGRQPADIAIAVAAEILRVRDAFEAESDR